VVEQAGGDIIPAAELGRTAFSTEQLFNYLTLEFLAERSLISHDSVFFLSIIVKNVVPAVNAGPDVTVIQGGIYGGSGSFIDPGLDTWTGTVDYGDGSGVQPLSLKPDKTFNLYHKYSSSGSYTVTVTIKDDDGGTGSDTVIVTMKK
jgi:hypothetical protein